MSMTRRDFLAISGALRARNPMPGCARQTLEAYRLQWEGDVQAVADAIAAKTPAGVFDKRRFLTDCGLMAEG
jgi:hypothetical protein